MYAVMSTHPFNRYIVTVTDSWLVTIGSNNHLQYSVCNEVTEMTQFSNMRKDVTVTIFQQDK
jgi:hypothetical protein